jgi:hypothetical protein
LGCAIVARSRSGGPNTLSLVAFRAAIVAGILLLVVFAGLRYAWRATSGLEAGALPVALLAVCVWPMALVGALGPTGCLSGIAGDPLALFEASPCSPAERLLLWPLAALLGEGLAAAALEAAAVGVALLLVHVLARGASSSAGAATFAQAGLALLLVTTLETSAGVAVTLALELLFLAHLFRRYAHLAGARDAAATTAYALGAQLGGEGASLDVAALVGVFSLVELWWGVRGSARRLLASWAIATAVVVAAGAAPWRGFVWAEARLDRTATASLTGCGLLALIGLVATTRLVAGRRRLLGAGLVAGVLRLSTGAPLVLLGPLATLAALGLERIVRVAKTPVA